MPEWTAEKLARLTQTEVKILRENAAKQQNKTIVALCDDELSRRKPSKVKRIGELRRSKEAVVHGFHFVCPSERGVTRNEDGTLWSGTWVVEKGHAERAVPIGAYLALHAAKAEPSYIQGVVRDWRSSKREAAYAEDRPAKTPIGIDFLIEPDNRPREWHGDGAGEKGYFYGDEQSGSC